MATAPEEDLATLQRHKANKRSVAEILANEFEECKQQLELWTKEQLRLKDRMKFEQENEFKERIQYVGGVDISFYKHDYVHACASLVVFSYAQNKMKVVYESCELVHLQNVYIPGYLAFREVPFFKNAMDKLRKEKPEYVPQVLLVDGNGVLHPHKFGLACHLGVELCIPTIGVAKKLFQVDGLEKNQAFKEKCSGLKKKGDAFDLVGDSGYIYGRALLGANNTTNPIFVSLGNGVNLETAIEIVCTCCENRVPKPIQFADQKSREYLRNNIEKHLKTCDFKDFESLNEKFSKIMSIIDEEKSSKRL